MKSAEPGIMYVRFVRALKIKERCVNLGDVRMRGVRGVVYVLSLCCAYIVVEFVYMA